MRVLLLGSGGRESALAWALSRSGRISDLVAAPGNPGIAELADTIDADIEDPAAVVALAKTIDASLVVVGPEAPLVAGVADALRAEGLKVFGPGAAGARLEGSKAYAKEVMERAGVPTARWRAFTSTGDAASYLDKLGPPYVVKADGLAAGKGVVVTTDRTAAVDAIEDRLVRGRFGAAGQTVVIEEFLDGEEASVIAFVDGRAVLACQPAQDYKRVGDGDTGPNTGGMGSYSPVPACPPEVLEQVVDEILRPTVAELGRVHPFVGALYAGLALTSRGPKVIEFNVRFGDPETQALVPRLDSDLGELALACAAGELEGVELRWSQASCVCVVLASRGYPGDYDSGLEITGIDEASRMEGVELFHAGTARRNGRLVTAGGRVLAVSAVGSGFGAARRRAYDAARLIEFEGRRFRSDIALRAEESEGVVAS